MSSSLNELTPIVSHIELTHLDSDTSNYLSSFENSLI